MRIKVLITIPLIESYMIIEYKNMNAFTHDTINHLHKIFEQKEVHIMYFPVGENIGINFLLLLVSLSIRHIML